MEKGATERGPNTPVRSEKLSLYLDGYDSEKASYLNKVFSEGFRIESEGLEGECLRVDNPRLPVHLRPVLQKKLQKGEETLSSCEDHQRSESRPRNVVSIFVRV